MKRTLDFDKFLAEKKRETMEITVCGRKYDVPMEYPAIINVMMARAEEDVESGDAVKYTFIAADALFGKQAVNQMCRDGLSALDMAELVGRTIRAINSAGEADDGDGETISEDDNYETVGGGGKK